MTGRMTSKLKSKRSTKIDSGKVNVKHSDGHDSSLLSKPVTTSITGLAKAFKVFHASTEEVRNYLTHECDIIYECRVCRSIFRSLFNFIMHKRSYCQEKFCHVTQTSWARNDDDDYLDIIYKETSEEADTDKVEKEEGNKKSKKKLSSIIEGLVQKKQFGLDMQNAFNEQCEKLNNECLVEGRGDKEKKILNLESIDGTSSGVFMSLKSQDVAKNKLEKTKVEVMELQSMLEGQSAVLGPDGKILNTNHNLVLVSKYSDENARLTCKQCNINFATRKTLMSHIKYKHESSRIVYPCLECSDTFASVWSVYRHLYGVHRKTGPQVRKMRNQIQAKAYRQDQAPEKSSYEQEKVNKIDINEQQKIDEENQAWMDNLETDNDMQMCGGCGRRFERKAALNAHSQTCQKRIAARNIIHVNKQKRAINAIDDKQTDKKSSKLIKLDNDIEKKQQDKPKSGVAKKRKIGIQIRYDYTKSTEKSTSSPVPTSNITGESSESLTVKNTSFIKRNSALDIETLIECSHQTPANRSASVISSSAVIVDSKVPTPINISLNKEIENINKSDNNLTAELLESEILSIPSSNSTPNKEEQDPLSIRDMQSDTDSEIEEILGPCPVSLFNEHITSARTGECSDRESTLPEYEDKDDTHVHENTLKLIQLINSNIPAENSKRTLDGRMSRFVSMKRLQCVPCDIKFSNISKLRYHMAMHFNWTRFRCDICAFKAYDKVNVSDHVKETHNIQEWEKIEAVILQIPDWESAEISSKDFLPIERRQENESIASNDLATVTLIEEKKNVVSSGSVTPDSCILIESNDKFITKSFKARPAKKLKGLKTLKITKKIDDAINNDVHSKDPLSECSSRASDATHVDSDRSSSRNSTNHTDSTSASTTDFALKKMVYEVIFGKDPELSKPNSIGVCDEEKGNSVHVVSTDVSNVISRPVRNRVKPLNKDFIYDLHGFKVQPKSVLPSSNNRTVSETKLAESIEDLHSSKKANRKRIKKSEKNYSQNVDNSVKHLNLQKRPNEMSLAGRGSFTIDNVTVVDPKGFLNDSNTSKSDGEDDDIYIVENEELVAVK